MVGCGVLWRRLTLTPAIGASVIRVAIVVTLQICTSGSAVSTSLEVAQRMRYDTMFPDNDVGMHTYDTYIRTKQTTRETKLLHTDLPVQVLVSISMASYENETH